MIAYAVVSKRPPLLGYNHNVRHLGRLFHVQTEDSGLSRLWITTHLFYEGTILATARCSYGAEDPDEVVQKKMQNQHKTMLKKLRDGAFDSLPEVSGQPRASSSASAGHRALSPDASAGHRAAATSASHAAVPKETAVDAPEETLRWMVPGKAKPPAVPPPPPPPRASGEHVESAAARSRGVASGMIDTAAARPVTVVPPAAVIPPGLATPLHKGAAILEFEADLPEDEEDLAPAMTIEADEPDVREIETEVLSSATPLPEARPLASLRDSLMPAQLLGSMGKVPALPTTAKGPSPASAAPLIQAPPLTSGVVARPQDPRLPQPAILRARPTAEGVSLQRPALATGAKPLDPLRTTSPRLRPTKPAPLAIAVPLVPVPQTPPDERSLDSVLLAYLARDVRR